MLEGKKMGEYGRGVGLAAQVFDEEKVETGLRWFSQKLMEEECGRNEEGKFDVEKSSLLRLGVRLSRRRLGSLLGASLSLILNTVSDIS